MKKCLLFLAAFLYSSSSGFAQTPTDHPPTGNSQPSVANVIPAEPPKDKGPWIISLGPAYNSHNTIFNNSEFNSTEAGFGGYISLERFVTPPLSLWLEFAGTHSNERSLLSEDDYILKFGPKIYPLMFGKQHPGRIEPFLDGFVGGNFFDFTYTFQKASPPFTYSTDPGLIAGGGGGLTVRLSDRWLITFAADYYRTLDNVTVRVSDGTKFHVHDSGVLITDGLSYRF